MLPQQHRLVHGMAVGDGDRHEVLDTGSGMHLAARILKGRNRDEL